jgi:hypothetical protein
VYYKVPETKNKTMEEISAMFRQRSYQWTFTPSSFIFEYKYKPVSLFPKAADSSLVFCTHKVLNVILLTL